MRRAFTFLFAVLIAGAGLAWTATRPRAFQTLTTHYEAIRQALLHDTLTDVKEHAEAIGREAGELSRRFDVTRSEVVETKSSACLQLLPEIANASRTLARASELKAARQAFGLLSAAMIRYRNMVPGKLPMVVYCSMTKRSWLQPEGDIGNPFLDQEMPTCGQVVSR